MYQIVFATNNQNKLIEIQALIGVNYKLISLKDLGFNEDIPEPHFTLEENALQKARTVYERFNMPCFADDTGLEVEYLNGAPGVFSARYSGFLSDFGSEENRSKANIDKLLHLLNGVQTRTARFRTVIAFITGKKEYAFEGIVNGQITDQMRGNTGFGYDPVFVPDGYESTFAEMTMDEKNKISHRAIAFKKFAEFLSSGIFSSSNQL